MAGNVTTPTFRFKAYGFVTNPGDPGWVDPTAPPEVQAQQLAIRKQRAAEWTKQAMAREAELEGAANG